MADHPILFKPEMVRALLDGRKTQTRRIINPQPPQNVVRHCWYSAPLYGFTHEHDVTDKWHVARLLGYQGDRLWVKETWRPHSLGETNWNIEISYAADGQWITIYDGEMGENDWNWPKAADRGNVSPLFMPKWASRITLPVTNVRVEKLQDISEADAVAEGCFKGKASARVFTNEASMHLGGDEWANARDWYADLWDSINAKPRPVKGDDGKVSHYVSYPWDGEPRTETYRGKPHHIHPNPWVAAYTFDVIKGNIDRIGGAV